MRDHRHRIKKRDGEVWLMTRRPLLCAQNAQKDAHQNRSQKERRRDGRRPLLRERREHITAALFF